MNDRKTTSDETTETPPAIDWAGHIERTLHVDHDGDSHTEPEDAVFHPSQLARCKRQATISKLGLDHHDTKTLGIFHTGTMIHEWLEESLEGRIPDVHHEHPVQATYFDDEQESDLVEITGTADVWDAHNKVVYDFKSRGGWYKFDPPSERHLNQLALYMDALGAEGGQVVYINKKDLEVRTWPEEGTFAPDPDRVEDLVQKAREIRDGIREATLIPDKDAVPFEACGCWLCNMEEDDG